MYKNCGLFNILVWRDVVEKERDLPITCQMFLTCAALDGSRPKWVWGRCGLQKVSWGGEGEGLPAGRTWEAVEQVTIKLRGLRGVLSGRGPRPESSTECCLTWEYHKLCEELHIVCRTSDQDVDGMATHVFGSSGLHRMGVETAQFVTFYVRAVGAEGGWGGK